MLDCLIRCKTGHKLYLTNPLSTQVCNTPIWSKRKLQRRCKVHLFTDRVAKVRASTDNTQSPRLRSHTSQLDWHSTSTVYTVCRRHHQLSSTTSWPGFLISKYRVSPISMVLSSILLKKCSDKVLPILLRAWNFDTKLPIHCDDEQGRLPKYAR